MLLERNIHGKLRLDCWQKKYTLRQYKKMLVSSLKKLDGQVDA